jgi:hypothetical protein
MNWRFGELGWLKQIEFTAVVAVAIALACVMIGQGAERFAASATSSEVALADGKAVGGSGHGPAFNAIDYSTTGAIKGQTVIISPCTIQDVRR